MNSDTPLSKWYQNISELPLTRFIDCIVDSNLYALVISGSPAIEDLQKAWSNISYQYSDSIRDGETITYARLNAAALETEITYKQTLILISELRQRYVVQFHKELNKLLFTRYKLDVTNAVEYDKELDNAFNRNKGIKIDLDLYKMKLEAARSKFTGKNSNPSREYFIDMLAVLSDHAGREITDRITVYEYCTRIHRLNKYHESLKRITYAKR